MVQSEKTLCIKRLKDAIAILEQERLEILGYEFGAEIAEEDDDDAAAFFILDELKSQNYAMLL